MTFYLEERLAIFVGGASPQGTQRALGFADHTGQRRVKSTMDIEVAVDMLEIANRVDHVALFSGDRDFRRLLESVQRREIRVSVFSGVKAQSPMASDEFRRQADTSVELAGPQQRIARAVPGAPAE